MTDHPLPNVLLVFADQWTYWALGCAGNPDVKTPNLDRLAERGVYCPQAVSGSPVCTPARGSLLTGMRPDTHGLVINDAPLNPERPSMGKHFADAGYDTAWIGKWHVDGHGRNGYIPPERRQGFEHFQVLECTHDYVDSKYYDGDDPVLKTWPEYDAVSQTKAMQAWIGSRSAEKPFFGVLSWGPPHGPYHTAPDNYQNYNPETLLIRENVPEKDRKPAAETLAGYFAHCEALDDCMGALVKTLEEQGVMDNTLLVFTSDHGDMLQSQGMYDKQCPWEESLRIPMMLSGPGLPAGSRNQSLIEFFDLWPTLGGLAGVPVEHPLHARDLSRELKEGGVPEDNSAFYASYVPFGNWIRQEMDRPLLEAREARGIRTPDWLYVEDLNGPWLLYDLEKDPYEMNNLVDSAEHTATRDRLAGQLKRRLELYEDRFLTGREYISRWGYKTDHTNTIVDL